MTRALFSIKTRYNIFMLLVPVSLAILGALLASFVGVLTERVYTGESIISGRSRCNSCGRTLSALDLIPVFSWFLSRGRCRTCKARVPGIYALAELSLGVLFVVSYLTFGLTLRLVLFLLILTILLFIVWYDLRHMVVPPAASTLLVVLSVLYAMSAWGGGLLLGAVFLTAGTIALAFFLLFALSKGRAMGLGDSPVALALSLIAGQKALAGLLFSFWIGAAVGILILVSRPKGHRMGIEVPFVPFLVLGYLLAIFTQWNPLTLTF